MTDVRSEVMAFRVTKTCRDVVRDLARLHAVTPSRIIERLVSQAARDQLAELTGAPVPDCGAGSAIADEVLAELKRRALVQFGDSTRWSDVQ